MTKRDKRLESIQRKVLFQVPLFVPGLARLPVVWDESVPTACTDGKRIRFNPQFFDQQEDQGLVTVLCEEVGHNLLGHLWRKPENGDHRKWNAACDHAVRWMMKDWSEIVMNKRLADPFPMPQPKELFEPSPEFRGLAEEIIYNRLPEAPPQRSGGRGKKGGGQGQGQPQDEQDDQRSEKDGAIGEFETPASSDAIEQKKLRSEWQQTLIQSVSMIKDRGNMPGSLLRLVDAIVDPKVPWTELLRSRLREQVADDYNWMKPDQYLIETGFMLPDLESERMGPVVFATDTSGSINQELLGSFQVEKQECLDTLKPRLLVDYCCDSRIHSRLEYRLGDRISQEAPGGGGTDFRPVFDDVARLCEQPKCLVYLTDLAGNFPSLAPDYPVLWVTWTKDKQAPFGETIYTGE